MASIFENKIVNWIWLVALILAPIVLWILPGDVFDYGKVSLCPSKMFFDYECFGCGITRAVQHAHNFQFADALFFNQLVVVVYPLLVIIWFIWVKGAARIVGLLK